MHLRLGSSLAPPETRGFLGISPSQVTQTPQRKLHFIKKFEAPIVDKISPLKGPVKGLARSP